MNFTLQNKTEPLLPEEIEGNASNSPFQIFSYRGG